MSFSQLRTASRFSSLPRGLTLAAASRSLKCDLGGPAIYNGRKSKRPRLPGEQSPQPSHVHQALRQVNWHIGLILALMWVTVILKQYT